MSVKSAIVALLATTFAVAVSAATPTVEASVCRTPPKIDGKLGDPCWKDAYVSPCFYDFVEKKTEGFQPNRDTTLRITADKEWVYLGIECLHPTPRDLAIKVKENFGGRVWGDECVKFFINPGVPGDNYFRYVVNAEGFYSLDRVFGKAPSTPMPVWPTATAINEKGWSAEIAIPLFYLVGYGDLKLFRMNVFRKKILNDYDAHGVKVGEAERIASWSPTGEWADYEKMGRVAGLGVAGVAVPFIANVADPVAGRVQTRDGKSFYPLSMTLKGLTGKAGVAEIAVEETFLDGRKSEFAEKFALKGNEVAPIVAQAPFAAPGQRTVAITVRDAESGLLFQKLALKDASAFNVLNAYARRNYYTSEPFAEIVYSLGFPESELKDKALAVLDKNGGIICRQSSPASRGALPLPLKTIGDGGHCFTMTLLGADGKKIFSKDFPLTKLPPKPGHEIKIDRLTGSLMKDGAPFFPFGAVTGVSEAAFKEMAETGFNSVIWWWNVEFNARDVLTMAEKRGLAVMVRPEKIDKATFLKNSARAETPKKYLSGKALKDCYAHFTEFSFFKEFHLFFPNLTRQQRNEIAAEVFDLNMPEALKNVQEAMTFSNLLGYSSIDEPLFAGQDLFVDLRKLYLAVKKTDPYRPMFALYSSKIPSGPDATSFMDCLGTDPYWTPGRMSERMTIDWVAKITAITTRRAKEAGLMPWIVPQATLWSDTHLRWITPREQTCQTYLGLINGAKGILYFTYELFCHVDHWKVAKQLAGQVKTLTPALTAPLPEQAIAYVPGECRPEEGVFPDVQAKVFQNPIGGHVLLFANMKEYPVDLTLSVDGLKPGNARRMFQNDVPAVVQDGAFKDHLDGMDVRAYALAGLDVGKPIAIKIVIQARAEGWKPVLGYPPEGRSDMKNVKPNPSFEEESVRGWPDYYSPLAKQSWEKRIGEDGAPIALTRENPFHGEKCLFVNNSCFYFRCAPRHKQPQAYVLSFYARTDNDKPIRCQVWGLGVAYKHSVAIKGREWKRYVVPLTVPADANTHVPIFILTQGAAYFDAIQMEQGDKATEFEP